MPHTDCGRPSRRDLRRARAACARRSPKRARQGQCGRDCQDGRQRARAFGIPQDDRRSPTTRRAFDHQREQFRAHAGHVRGDEYGKFATDALEADQRAGQRAFIRDRVAHEQNAIRVLR